MFIKIFSESKIIILIILLASFLRLWDLGGMPPHLRNDEASLGYNSYSILKTLKDEHGDFLPIFFQSFGDWKPGGYIYLSTPFIAVLGLNEVTVRLPSALSGIISVWLIYQIVSILFTKKRLAQVSALMFAISPINLAFSRGAWEVNVSLTLTLAGILFFLKAIKGKSRFLLLSALFFGLTLITSHTAKLSTPIMLLILSLVFRNDLKRLPVKIIIISFLIGLIFVIPVALSIFNGKITRLTTLSIFSYQSGFSLIQSVANRWFSLYSAATLFLKGDTNPQHTAPNIGPFLLFDLALMTLGLIRLIRKEGQAQKVFVFLGLALLPLPAVLTIENINLERILPVFIPLIIIVALGADLLIEDFKNKFIKLIFIFVLVYSLNYIYFLDLYFIEGSKKNDAWQYGYKQIFEKTNSYKEEVIVQQSLEQPYIFLLFYLKYDPIKYQTIVNKVFIPNKEGKDMGLVSGINNIKFLDIDWSKQKPELNQIFVVPYYKLAQESKFYSNYQLIDEVRDLNGLPLFKIVKII